MGPENSVCQGAKKHANKHQVKEDQTHMPFGNGMCV